MGGGMVTPQLCLVAAKALAKIGLSFERNGNLFTVFYSKIKQKKTYFYDLFKKKNLGNPRMTVRIMSVFQ